MHGSDNRPAPEWRPAAGKIELGGAAVQVWRVATGQPSRALDTCAGLLSDGERARAGRFHFEADRARYVLVHGLLRLLLGHYLGLAPEAVTVQTGPQGKPALAADLGSDLTFNLSHSKDCALIAVTRARAVGVDVERIRADVDVMGLAARFFSLAEAAALRALPADQQIDAFFRCWTRKEAFVKARGDGLGFPLDRFEVSLDPNAPAALLALRDPDDRLDRWRLAALDPGDGYTGALAVAGPPWSLSCWDAAGLGRILALK